MKDIKEISVDDDMLEEFTKNNPKLSNKPPKLREPVLIDIDKIDDNPYSANVEDTATFTKLQEGIDKHGLLEIPVVRKTPEGRYLMMSGKHRKDAFKSLGGKQIYAIVMDSDLSPEEEFNEVNNFNLIKGDMKKKELVKIAKEHNLDPTKIDLFKIPSRLLFPVVDVSDINKAQEETRRNARLNQLILEIAKVIGPHVLKDRDELITVMLVQDSVVAILRIPFVDKKKCREKAEDIEAKLTKALAEFSVDEDEPQIEGDQDE